MWQLASTVSASMGLSGYSRSLLPSTLLRVFLVACGSGIWHWSNSQVKAVILTQAFSHNLHLLSHAHQAPAVLNSGSLSTNGHYSVPAPKCLFGFQYSFFPSHLLLTCLKISPQTPTVLTVCSLSSKSLSCLSLHCGFRILTYQHLYGSSLEHTLKSQSNLQEQYWGQHNVGQVMLNCLTPVSDEFFYWRSSPKPTIESTFYNSDIIWMY